MKLAVSVLLAFVAVYALGHPDSELRLDIEDIFHEQDIGDDNEITGYYSWTSPEGSTYFVRYIADEDGYRVIDSNAVPSTLHGLRADGEQVSFDSYEEDDDKK